MVSLRGDAHKYYLRLKKDALKGLEPANSKEIKELQDIHSFYETIESSTLKNIHHWILKEKSGSGLIPILVTAVPWILFIFGNQVQAFFKEDSYLWVLFVFFYLTAVSISVSIHFKERAWATVHSRIIEDIFNNREEPLQKSDE